MRIPDRKNLHLLPSSRRFRDSVLIPSLLAAVTLSFASLSACSSHSATVQPEPTAQLGAQASSAPARAELSNGNTIADVVEVVLPSVVSVTSTRTQVAVSPWGQFFGQPPSKQKQQGLGSGVILTADGLVVTNNHVVEGADSLLVRVFDERVFEAKVIGTDPKSDLAVLQLQGDVSDLKPIAIGPSSQVRLGELVLAVGNPFGVGQTVTQGIVSAKGRVDMGIVDYEDFIQTDAAINPGNSGGALINARGELVGINTAILSRSGGYMGIGFAIPTDMAVPIIEALRTDGRVTRGFLGVGIQELSKDLQQALRLDDGQGVLIADVQPDGPAALAGVEGGDVVTAVGEQKVDSTGRFRNLIASAGADKEVVLHIFRDGKKLKLKAKLGTLSDETEQPPLAEKKDDGGPAIDGLSLRTLDNDLRRQLRVPADVKGAVIVRVEPASKAAQASLRRGDIIVQVDRKPVATAAEAKKHYESVEGPRLLLVIRRGSKSYVVVK